MSAIDERADAPMLVRALEKGKFVRVNDSFKAKVGFDAAELAEKPFLDWIDPRDRAMVQAALENDESSFFARHITRDGNSLQLRIELAKHQDGLFVLGRCAKLPAQLESDAARSAQASVSGTLDAIARIIEEQNPGYKCSILLVADGRFVFGAGPSLPDDYNAAVDGYAVGPTVGSCGTAIFWNTPVIVEDIQADPLWSALAALAKKAGVAACWSHPFVGSSGNVLGALALYSPEPRTPTAEQLSLLKASARITGLAVERGRAEEELKRADEAITVVRNQLQATLNALPDLLFEVDAEGCFFRYHTHRTDLLAAPPEEFLGKRFADVLPPEAAAACQRAIDEAAQEGFSYGETFRLALPQGEHWFELAVAPMQVDDTSNQRFVIISRDITERRAGVLALEEMSKALATSRDLLQQIIDTAPVRVFWKDREGRFLGCNPAFARDAGMRTPSELIGRDDYAMDWAAQADLYRADDMAVMQTGQARLNFEEPQTTPDGKTIWLRTSKVPLRDATGKVVGVLGLYDDITEQKREERRHALALDASSILIWEMDFVTGKLGYDGSAMIGLGLDKANAPDTLAAWQARVHSDDRPRFTENVAQALQPDDTRGFDCEYRLDDNAGGYHWLQTVGKVVQRDAAGRPLLGAGYLVNIDERKQAEADLIEAKNAAVKANLAKSQFLATMSHEIRTPMNGVLGMAQLLLMPGISEDERYEYARVIHNSGHTLLTLLNDILDISKVEAGKLKLERVACDPQQISEEVVALFAESAQSKGLTIESMCHGTQGQRYWADPLRLRQMLSNLVGNAIKFTEQGFVRLEVTDLGRKDNSALLEFSVTDSGIGVTPDKQSVLFQAFTQADNSITREYGGTGLGLSIVRSLAKLMGGEVGIESEAGKGASFWFHIRADLVLHEEESRHAERGAKTAQETPSSDRGERRVLVVEDNLNNRMVVQALLRKLNLQSDSAENGQEAVDAITRGMQPDLVLMDVQMPVLDGLKATEYIRQWEKEAGRPHLPIVALTAGAFEEDQLACLAAGMDDYLSKPISMDALAATLAKWMAMQGTLPSPDRSKVQWQQTE